MDTDRNEAPSPADHDSADSGKDFTKPGMDPENAPNVADHKGYDTDKHEDEDTRQGFSTRPAASDRP